MTTNALHQASFPFLAAANEGARRAPVAAPAARAVRAFRTRRPRPMSVDARSFHPVHVTLRWLDAVLGPRDPARRDALEAAVHAAIAATRDLADFHVFHAAVRANGVHLLVQADTDAALAAGVDAFSTATARRLSRATARICRLFAPGFDVVPLRTSAEFREALRLLIGPERGGGAA
jgi:hypothetical protein